MPISAKTTHRKARRTQRGFRASCTRAINKFNALATSSATITRNCTRAILFAAASLTPLSASADALKVFAAASLTNALDAALISCTADTNDTAIGVYAGSGTIARQIEQGAPANIFISANPEWMDWLEKRERVAAETRVDLLGNRLVIVASDQSADLLRGDGADPWARLADARIAVADTDSVPAGIYARQSLEAQGWWRKAEIQSALVQASNVREALTWVLRGEADFGIVYASDAQSAPALTSALIDAETHDPIHYPAAIVSDHDSPNARRLLTCLQGEEASGIFSEYGFIVPE